MIRIFLLLLLLVGCATSNPCPPQDVYFIITYGDGTSKIVQMDKGYLDERSNWKSEDEMIEWYRQKNERAN